jgi:hypothetical protein
MTLTFSPVKSVSTLWAVAEPAVAAVIEQAHQAAVKDALPFIEKRALFTRTGPQGIRQLTSGAWSPLRSPIVTAGPATRTCTPRRSRQQGPDPRRTVAVDRRPGAVQGQLAASETYNTALEQHLRETLGVRFAERPGTDPAKRPIREIMGVEPVLNQRWSSRRALIKDRQGELAAQFQRDHGRPPTPIEALHLAQQATLETRDAKHEPRSLAEQRAVWHAQAAATLGGPDVVQAMINKTLNPTAEPNPAVDAEWGGGSRREGVGGGGGTPVDLAELACPRRSATPGPGRIDSHRQS